MELAWRLLERICTDEAGQIRLLRQMLFDLEKAKLITEASFTRLVDHEGAQGAHMRSAFILLAEMAP